MTMIRRKYYVPRSESSRYYGREGDLPVWAVGFSEVIEDEDLPLERQ